MTKINGSRKPMTFDAERQRVLVAVAVRAMTLTFGGSMLRISPMRCKLLLKVSPLATSNTVKSTTLHNIRQVCIRFSVYVSWPCSHLHLHTCVCMCV